MKKSSDDTGAFLIFAGIGVILFAIAYFCDIDKLSRGIEKWIDHICTSKDPGSFITLLVIAIIAGGLLMAIEYRPRK